MVYDRCFSCPASEWFIVVLLPVIYFRGVAGVRGGVARRRKGRARAFVNRLAWCLVWLARLEGQIPCDACFVGFPSVRFFDVSH